MQGRIKVSREMGRCERRGGEENDRVNSRRRGAGAGDAIKGEEEERRETGK